MSTDAGDVTSTDAGDVASTYATEISPSHFPQSIASGDPRPGGAILWTRVVPDGGGQDDVSLILEVAEDEAFKRLVRLDGKNEKKVSAQAKFDRCVKVRLTGLSAATIYYYRFIHTVDGKHLSTRVGTVKTAPKPDADVKVRFAVVSCQDYNGRYYNVYRRLAREDLDFVLHLGDYVYETTGNASFQKTGSKRSVKFADEKGAIVFNAGKDNEYYAAKSLDNYRDLYRTFRSDPDLQAMHERAAMICIPDDHEYSDDCWGATGTYHDGKQDERDEARRKDADQAWFEYMPVDYLDAPDYTFDRETKFPGDMRVYRDLVFGKHVHVLMTDLRRYRADHQIPEEAFPGAVAVTQAELETTLGSVPDHARPYFDIDAYEAGKYATMLKTAAKKLEIEADALKGSISADWVNTQIETLNEGKDEKDKVAGIAKDALAKMERGLAYHHFFKTSHHSMLGSRYLVLQDAFEAYAKVRYKATGGKSEVVLGEEQRKWFLDSVKASKQTWKIWGNEYCLLKRVADLTPFPESVVSPAFRQRFLLSAEDWDGFPNRRDELIGGLAEAGNVVAVTGDIHAFFASTPWVSTDPTKRVVEFVTGAISSTSYKSMLLSQATSNQALIDAGAASLAAVADKIILGDFAEDPTKRPNPHLGYASLDRNGCMVLEADGKELVTTLFEIFEGNNDEDLGTGDKLDKAFGYVRFKVVSGSADLHREEGGSWKRWDSDKCAWV